MIGIYARQSIDKKDSISIETQIEFCKNEINGKYKVFEDKGFSGKNTQRPAFINLMNDVKNGKLSKIVVYRLDRISRSITDFAGIMDILNENNVDFVSTTEKFDTSTPVGRAMLYIIMVFAQLERETIAQRIKDNYYERGKTGVWLGGPAPFGFEIKKNLNGNHKKISVLSPTQDINLIKKIYDTYANSNISLGYLAREIRKDTNQMWNNIKLSRILHNPAYVKADVDIYNFFKMKNCVIINPVEEFNGKYGCSLYGKRDRSKNKYRTLDEQVLSLSFHEGIIDSKTWLKCQMKLENNVQIKNSGKGKYTWLSGLIKCGYCGYGMNIKTYKDIKYLNCSGRYMRDNTCIDKIQTHYLKDIEDYVFNQMEIFVDNYKKNNYTSEKISANTNQINELKMKLVSIDTQIQNLLEAIANANETLTKYANEKINSLDEQKKSIISQLTNFNIEPEKIKLPNLQKWNTFNIETKKSIANYLIDKILVYNEKIEMVWNY